MRDIIDAIPYLTHGGTGLTGSEPWVSPAGLAGWRSRSVNACRLGTKQPSRSDLKPLNPGRCHRFGTEEESRQRLGIRQRRSLGVQPGDGSLGVCRIRSYVAVKWTYQNRAGQPPVSADLGRSARAMQSLELR
jgi:hypothetical protein